MPVEHNRAFAPQIKAMKEAGVDENGKKTAGPTPDQIASGLEASSNLSGSTGHPGPDIRPCIARLIETSLTRGDFPDRNRAAVVIASELKRIGENFGASNRRLEQWNSKNKPPLREREVERVLDNSFSHEYNYGCRNPILLEFCIGEDCCPFASRVRSKPNRLNDLKFIDYGWPRVLTSRQVLLYSVALPYLEKTRQVGLGGLIYANHQQLADACGITRRRLGDDLRALGLLGLIDYEPGISRKWEGKASEIRRIFPIPRLTHKHTELLSQSKSGETSGSPIVWNTYSCRDKKTSDVATKRHTERKGG